MTNSALVLENAQVLMRKISNNLLNFGTEKVTAFTLPFEGFSLNHEQLDAFVGECTFRSWFDQRPDGIWVPMSWWSKRKKGDFHVEHEFECNAASILVSGDQLLEFEPYQPKDENEAPSPAARITNIVLTPTEGGITLMSFHMRVRPGVGKTNLLLQEHQFRRVTVTVGDTRLIGDRAQQQQLPLKQPEGDAVVLTGAHIPHEDRQNFERDAAAQVSAFNARPGEVIDGRSERVRHMDQPRRRGGY